jgi:hypothetical protein
MDIRHTDSIVKPAMGSHLETAHTLAVKSANIAVDTGGMVSTTLAKRSAPRSNVLSNLDHSNAISSALTDIAEVVGRTLGPHGSNTLIRDESGSHIATKDGYTVLQRLTQYSEIKDATYVRGFLGRMLFAGEDGTKKMRVLSGGEKVRVLLSRMMIQASNVLILDEPTDHLDMESITALNNGLIKFPGVILFASRDHQVVQTTANRIIEFLPDGTFVDKVSSYDEYLENDEMARKRQVYSMSDDDASDN